jgi:hypothetical protein
VLGGAPYLRLVLMDLHGGANCCLDIVPLGLRGVEDLHGMRSSRNLEKEDGRTVKINSFCYSRKAKEDRGIDNYARQGCGK